VAPDPDDNRYGYCHVARGYLGRYDRKTGYTKNIRPTHPDPKMKVTVQLELGARTRSFDNSTIYYGSQFVHQSTDKVLPGKLSQEILLPTMPKNKKQYESGGLTMDATGAENHCTILAISPSKRKKDCMVGTDDGQVQLTRDGAKPGRT